MNSQTTPRRWFPVTPDRCVLGLLVVEGLFWLGERFQWFDKGWAVLTAFIAFGATILLMLAWWFSSTILRLRFQFSLRALCVLTLAAALPLSWLVVEKENARRQNESLNWVGKLHGTVGLHWGRTYEGLDSGSDVGEPPPEWLRSKFGDHFFLVLHRLDFSNSQIADADLKNLAQFSDLKRLFLDWTHVTDAGMAHLSGLKSLEQLSLIKTDITDAGLQSLRPLTSLRVLRLRDTKITDSGLESLTELKQLQVLWLSGTVVTDSGAANLQRALLNCSVTR